jgi:alkylhydroperoxidase family enzyme
MADDTHTFLAEPEPTEPARALYAGDLDGGGYVMNLTRLWGHAPSAHDGVVALMDAGTEVGGLTFRQKAVLVSATASTSGDSYCSLAWGSRLAGEVGAETAAAVLSGDDTGLDPTERALARWARAVAGDPNGTTTDDVQALRDVGFTDAQILGITAFIAARLAFSTVNDALGARPDVQLVDAAPDTVLATVDWGRPPARD